MGRYIVTADVEARISHELAREIMDDDVDGEIDKAVIDRYIADAESTVESYLRKVFSLQALRDTAAADRNNVPNEVKRLCLDVCVGRLFQRFPEYVRAKGDKMVEMAREELREFARGLRRLDDIDTIEDTAQVTVQARSGDPDDPDPPDKFFLDPDSFGVF